MLAQFCEPVGIAREKSVPVPVATMVCGLPWALSVIVIPPVLAPLMLGVKVTVIVQWAPAANDVPQLLVCAKSVLDTGSLKAAIEVMASATFPVLVKVTDCAELVVATI